MTFILFSLASSAVTLHSHSWISMLPGVLSPKPGPRQCKEGRGTQMFRENHESLAIPGYPQISKADLNFPMPHTRKLECRDTETTAARLQMSFSLRDSR